MLSISDTLKFWPYMGYEFHIFWMRMVFPKPRSDFHALFSSLNIPLLDDHRLYTPSIIIFRCILCVRGEKKKGPRREKVSCSMQMSSRPRENRLKWQDSSI